MRIANPGIGRGRRPQTIRVPTDPAKLGYIAGLIDGEGTVDVFPHQNPRYVRPIVEVFNTDLKMMRWLAGQTNVPFHELHRNNGSPGWKVCYGWRLEQRANVKALLTAVLPYLVTKKANATRTLEVCT